MGRRKPFIDKSKAVRFHVVHRSAASATSAAHDGDTADATSSSSSSSSTDKAQFYLQPASSSAFPLPQGFPTDVLLHENEQAEYEYVAQRERARRKADRSAEDPSRLPHEYDYGVHMKPISGRGFWLSAAAAASAASTSLEPNAKLLKKRLQQADVVGPLEGDARSSRPVVEDELDREVDVELVREAEHQAESMPKRRRMRLMKQAKDVVRALEDEEGEMELEELEDDFVIRAIRGEGGAEDEDEGGEGDDGEYGEHDDDDDDGEYGEYDDDEYAYGEDVIEEIVEEDAEDDEDEEEEDEEDAEEAQEEGAKEAQDDDADSKARAQSKSATRRRPAESSSASSASSRTTLVERLAKETAARRNRALDDAFERMMSKEYADDDDEDDEGEGGEYGGPDRGRNSIGDDEDEDGDDEEGADEDDGADDGNNKDVTSYTAGFAQTVVHLQDQDRANTYKKDGDVLDAGTPEERLALKRAMEARIAAIRLEEEQLAAQGVTDEQLIDGMFKHRAEAEWDCQSIVSTYSNLENHPTTIGAPDRRAKGARGGKSGRGAPAAPAAAAAGGSHASSAATIIQISMKTGIPLGVLPARTTRKQQQELERQQQQQQQQGEGDEEDDDNDDEDDEDEDDADTPSRLSTSQPRPAFETPEERRARKQAVKAAQRENRARKKQLRSIYGQVAHEQRMLDVKQRMLNPVTKKL